MPARTIVPLYGDQVSTLTLLIASYSFLANHEQLQTDLKEHYVFLVRSVNRAAYGSLILGILRRLSRHRNPDSGGQAEPWLFGDIVSD